MLPRNRQSILCKMKELSVRIQLNPLEKGCLYEQIIIGAGNDYLLLLLEN